MDNSQSYFLLFLRLLGSLALLMYGMKTMSDALQKMAGPQLRHVLGAMTTNRFTGMLTGVGVTAAVQSSTATTVMTVSFVSAGLLTLAQAISVIMRLSSILHRYNTHIPQEKPRDWRLPLWYRLHVPRSGHFATNGYRP